MLPSIKALQLVKKYNSEKNEFVAVDSLSFEILPGETVAFLGPNGAGKSTTIKMLCGILTPTSGLSQINGHTSGSQAANRDIGLVFGTRSQLFMHMTVHQCLDFISEIYSLTGALKKSRISELAEMFELTNLLTRRVRTLSLGQRMRCELVAALLHKPKVLLADEPTIGLDIIAKNQLRELIKRWQNEERSTLLLTSHDLSDVEVLCERCLLIDHGRLQYDGPLSSLKGNLEDIRRIQVTVSDEKIRPLDITNGIQLLKNESYTHQYEIQTSEVQMSSALAQLSSHYEKNLQDIQISEVSLEEVLSKRYQRLRP